MRPLAGLAIALPAAAMAAWLTVGGATPGAVADPTPRPDRRVAVLARPTGAPVGDMVVSVPVALLGRPSGLPRTLPTGGTATFTVPLWVAAGERNPRLRTRARHAQLTCAPANELRPGAVTMLSCEIQITRSAPPGAAVDITFVVTTRAKPARLRLEAPLHVT